MGFDGGNVAVTLDAGLTWEVLNPVDGYPDQGIPGLDLPGAVDMEAGFTGESGGWINSIFDMSDYIGNTITLRLRLGSDLGMNKAGWFISDLLIDEYNAVEEGAEGLAGLKFALGQNYPNPFNPTTVISFQLPAASHVDLKVYNTTGQLVKTLATGDLEPGAHSVSWNGSNDLDRHVTSGVYFYTLTTDTDISTMRMVLLK